MIVNSEFWHDISLGDITGDYSLAVVAFRLFNHLFSDIHQFPILGAIIEYPSTFETTFKGRNTNQDAVNWFR